MFKIIKNIVKGMVKVRLGRQLSGSERFLLTSLYSKVDRIATLITASNVHPQLIDKDYDFVKLTSNVDANIELFDKLLEKFPNFDAAVPACWLGLAGCGLEEMGTTMRISPIIEPTPHIFALDRMKLEDLSFPKMTGELEKRITLCAEVQDRYPNLNSPPILLGAFDLAILLRGERLISDFRIYKDFITTSDEERKTKIKKRGDPMFFSKLLEFTSEASIFIGNLYKENGLNMLGAAFVDQYANPPLLSPNDFLEYIYPYAEKIWRNFKRYRPTFGYMPPSPNVASEITKYPALSGIACFNNYMFPQDDIGLTPPEYDEEMVKLSERVKTPYQFLIHGKFLRDGTIKELQNQVVRVCNLALKYNVPMSIGFAAVPLGTDISKIHKILEIINTRGVYE